MTGERLDRRALLLAAGGGAAWLGGCLSAADPDSTGDGARSTVTSERIGTRDGGDSGSASVPEPSGECGPAATSLSSRLEPDGGETDACSEGLRPSFAVANEREEAVSVAVEIRADGESVAAFAYDLEPGERAVESSVAPAADLAAVTVTFDGEGDRLTGTWDDRSCRRHAVAIVPGGVEVGYVPPLDGRADANHDCYAGDEKPIWLGNDGPERSMTVTVVDHCDETVREETLTLERDGVRRLDGALTSGGVYHVVVDVEDGGTSVFEYDGECWGVHANVSPDGEPGLALTYPW